MFRFTASPPLSLYVHIPWCVRKCPYCDFNSHQAPEALPEQAYVDALLGDLEQDLPRVWGRTVETVFIGGGTPSLFSAEAIDRLLSGLRARLSLKPDAEITLEANPGTLEQGRFIEFRGAGINRLSIGVQSFDPQMLERIGRIHGRDEAVRAAEMAHQAGFETFNLDLMFGLPGQSREQALGDLQQAMDLEPPHLSWYQLTLEPNTWFHHHPPELPDDDGIMVMQEAGQRALAARDYTQYEVSAYARPGFQCRHNLNYWRFGDYLGIGAGAHGKLTDGASQSITRLWKIKHPREYLAHAGEPSVIGGEQMVSPADAAFEYMLNGLRLNEGVELGHFERVAGLDRSVLAAAADQAVDQGLLARDGSRLNPTPAGRRYLNDLMALFLPGEHEHAGDGRR